MRLVRGRGWNLALRAACAAPLLLLSAGVAALIVIRGWDSPDFGTLVLMVPLPLLGAICAWRALLLLRLSWWVPGFVLLGGTCWMLVVAAAFDLDRMPEDPRPWHV